MVALPKAPEAQILDRVYAAYEQREAQLNPRLYLGRLGSSFIGDECLRKIWFSWRAYSRTAFSGRMLRLFQTGHLQEERVVEDLRRAGLQVWAQDSEGAQFEWTDDTGHLITKVDGVVRGVPDREAVPHVLEVKTHNKNSFSALLKHGVQKAKPEHYAQMQTSLWLGGFSRALYVAVCKDDEQFYAERVRPDPALHGELKGRVHKLLDARLRPAGISADAEAFGCKFCDHREVCTGRAAPVRSCRSCAAAEPLAERGAWRCGYSGRELSLDEQRAGCSEYQPL